MAIKETGQKILKLAIRNVIRNQRRSFLTMLIILVSFLSLSVFVGYLQSLRKVWSQMLVRGEYGHLQIFHKNFREDDDASYTSMISPAQYKEIQYLLNGIPEILYYTPRVMFSGIIGTSSGSKIFVGSARSSSEQVNLYTSRFASSGSFVQENNPNGIVISEILANRLKLKLNDQALVMTTSQQGSLEAINGTVIGISPSYSSYDLRVILPLDSAKNLILNSNFHNVVILLESTDQLDTVYREITKRITLAKLPLVVKTFYEVATFYAQVLGMYERYFMICFVILSIVIIFSLWNTMVMSITDRIREFSTMRTIGISRKAIFFLIVMEGSILAVLALSAGIFVSYWIHLGINFSNILLPPPPGSNREIPFKVLYDFGINLKLAGAFVLVTSLTSMIPAIFVTRVSITKGLRYD
jgi:putative ABC transport system permease protein